MNRVRFRNLSYTALVLTVTFVNPLLLLAVAYGLAYLDSAVRVIFVLALAAVLTFLASRAFRAGVEVTGDGGSIKVRSVLRVWEARIADIERVEYRWSPILDIIMPFNLISGTFGIIRRREDGSTQFTRIPGDCRDFCVWA